MSGSTLRVDLLTLDGGWREIGRVTPGMPPGSMSSHEPAGRQVYVFGWHEGVVGLWRSAGGADVESGSARLVLSENLEAVADLTEPHELTIHRQGGAVVTIRFTVT